jgi:hypothetical protein
MDIEYQTFYARWKGQNLTVKIMKIEYQQGMNFFNNTIFFSNSRNRIIFEHFFKSRANSYLADAISGNRADQTR